MNNGLKILASFYLLSQAVIRGCSVKTVFFKNFAKFTGKRLCQSLFFDKVAGLRSENF